MHFIHLYFLPEHFTQRAIRELDREPRELKLADRTYFEDVRVAALRSLALDGWDDADERLRVNETAHEVLSLLLRGQSTTRTDTSFRGGASHRPRRVRDYIDTYLTQPLTLGELADVAALSEYHFRGCSGCRSAARRTHGWPNSASRGRASCCARRRCRSRRSRPTAAMRTPATSAIAFATHMARRRIRTGAVMQPLSAAPFSLLLLTRRAATAPVRAPRRRPAGRPAPSGRPSCGRTHAACGTGCVRGTARPSARSVRSASRTAPKSRPGTASRYGRRPFPA